MTQRHREPFELILGFLSGTPITRDLHHRLLKILASTATTESYAEGDYLFQRDDHANRCHIIREGSV